MLGVIPPAAFGKGGETVYDASVRDALQLKAERYELSIPQGTIDGVLRTIVRGMDLQTDVVAEPYSLNVYRKGGKFVRHKDTPRGDDMLGTLVICLPTWYVVSLHLHSVVHFLSFVADIRSLNWHDAGSMVGR